VRSGGTLFESAKVLKDAGATAVSVFVAHAAFPQSAWKRFARGGDRDIFERFWTTNRCVVRGVRCVLGFITMNPPPLRRGPLTLPLPPPFTVPLTLLFTLPLTLPLSPFPSHPSPPTLPLPHSPLTPPPFLAASCPKVASELPTDDAFTVLDITSLVVQDL
jgi:hypothetical protein